MAVFNEPTQWDHELGNNADVSTLPDDTGATTGVASLQKLFQVINQTPLEAGGVAPDREDFNALFKILGDSVFYGMNGGLASYNPAYDYVVGRYVVYNNTLYKCIQANGASSTVVAPDSVSPLGSDYWKDIENQDTTSLIPNQIIQSPVPLTDANLHQLDGAKLDGSGAYSEYVTMMGALHDADPTANCWTDEATWQASVTNTGSCGKFVYDSVNNTLRLPKYDARYLKSTLSASDLGDLVNAQSPNIKADLTSSFRGNQANTSDWGFNINTSYRSGAVEDYGYPNNPSKTTYLNGGNAGTIYLMEGNIDASRSSSVYSDSATTIDTDAVKVYYYIVLGTVSKLAIQVDIDQIVTDLNGKADKDFSNVTAPTQTFKDMSIGWVMPDYDSAIDIKSSLSTSPTQITIAKDSYLQAKATYSGAFARILYVDGVEVLIVSGNASPAQSGLIPIKAGVHSMYVDAISFVDYVKVIPMLGAN